MVKTLKKEKMKGNFDPIKFLFNWGFRFPKQVFIILGFLKHNYFCITSLFLFITGTILTGFLILCFIMSEGNS